MVRQTRPYCEGENQVPLHQEQLSFDGGPLPLRRFASVGEQTLKTFLAINGERIPSAFARRERADKIKQPPLFIPQDLGRLALL